ncbi:AAA family ATPase [Nonomuraea sp. NPDC003754]
MRNLVRIRVTALLGMFDHEVHFPADQEIAILYGPNGVGKTKLLELVNAALAPNPRRLAAIPFGTATFSFDDGYRLVVEKSEPRRPLKVRARALHMMSTVLFKLYQGSTLIAKSPHDDPPAELERLSAILPPRILRSLEDLADIDAAEVDIVELLENYGGTISPSVLESITIPPEIREFCDSADIRLIETQRLVVHHRRHRSSASTRTSPEEATREVTAQEFAFDLAQRIAGALAQNSRTSQQLDKDFPRQLMLDPLIPEAATQEAIRGKYEEQSNLRRKLAEASLIDNTDDLPLPSRSLQDWERLVLWNYLSDTEKKLATFEPLLERIDLLKEIINSRFLYKRLIVDREKGFYFSTESGSVVAPRQLSSGEQHELVLLYDLLFNVKPGALVLIDEPEISLHVAWQRQFLSDISRVARLSSCRFIVATHSPQIMGKWASGAIALAPDYKPDEI